MEETVSISKGCFLFMPKQFKSSSATLKRTRKRKAPKSSLSATYGYAFPGLDSESKEQTESRYKLYEKCWTGLSKEIESIQTDLNGRIFRDLLGFIASSYRTRASKTPIKEIPTAALLTGVNMPDHEVIFDQMVSELHKTITPHTALLHSKDCTSLKFMLRETLSEIMNLDEEIDEDDENIVGNIKHFTLPVLRDWYQMKNKQETHKRRRLTDEPNIPENPPVVVILEDFESFNPAVVQDFVLICSEYIHELPVILVLGVATTVAAIHRSLPHSVSCRLSIEKFQAQPSLVCLTEILDKVLLTPDRSFKLGPEVSKLLYNNFLCHDFSIQNYVRGFQFCMMEYFYSSPLSILCNSDMETLQSSINKLSKEQIDWIRKIESFQEFIDRKSLEEQKHLKENDKHVKEIVYLLMLNAKKFHYNYFPVLKCLHILASRLPKCPLGKRLINVHDFNMERGITRTEKYNEILCLLRILSRDELLPLLKESHETLSENIKRHKFCNTMEEHKKTLETFLDRFDHLDEIIQENAILDQKGATPKTPKMAVFKNRFEFQEKMRQAVKEKRQSPFDKLRNEVIDFWDGMFRKYLRSPMTLPLHEIIYYDNIDEVSQHIDGAPRVGLQNGLTNPHLYLQCKCCKIDPDDNQDTLPDISILYKLHMECGRLINLFDWLQAFTAVVSPSFGSSKSSKKNKLDAEQLQARFIRSVSELQLLGFIKSTKRKTDHVQRLTWGSC